MTESVINAALDSMKLNGYRQVSDVFPLSGGGNVVIVADVNDALYRMIIKDVQAIPAKKAFNSRFNFN